jgi:hypothetical protein
MLKFYFAGIISACLTHLWEKGRIRSRIRIREAQKHPNSDPQHWCLWFNTYKLKLEHPSSHWRPSSFRDYPDGLRLLSKDSLRELVLNNPDYASLTSFHLGFICSSESDTEEEDKEVEAQIRSPGGKKTELQRSEQGPVISTPARPVRSSTARPDRSKARPVRKSLAAGEAGRPLASGEAGRPLATQEAGRLLASGEDASVVKAREEDGFEGQGPQKEASTAQQGDADESGSRAVPAVELLNSRSKRVIRR